MKSRLFLMVVGLMLVMFCYTSAQVPQMINYQGKLTTPVGAPVNDTVQMVFTIYADSGGITSKWSETQTGVNVEKGVFNVLLGSVNPIPDSVFNGSVRYLGVKVESDPEITPRKPMVSVAYAYRAGSGGGGSDNDWTYRITDTADTTLITGGAWGIARYGNELYGNADSTHVNLGVACTTGTSEQNFKYCTVGGGYTNRATLPYATVGGGGDNAASYWYATVGGGLNNTASGIHSTVAGGWNNAATRQAATVGGGQSDTARDMAATVGGGILNTASGTSATVGGGANNMASGYMATIPGGFRDTAAGDFSFAAGYQVRLTSTASYSFAFGNDFTVTIPNAVVFSHPSAATRVGINLTNPAYAIDLPNNANASGQGRANAWNIYSSIRWKENISPIDQALEKVLSLRGVYFDWKESHKRDMGMIAEEVGKVIPEVVSYEENGDNAEAMDYARLSALLVEAIKEQQQTINQQQHAIQEHKEEIELLKAKLEKLESTK
jgi:hypothetical protein